MYEIEIGIEIVNFWTMARSIELSNSAQSLFGVKFFQGKYQI